MAPEKLSKKVLNIIKDGDNDIYISPITFWEITMKHQLGKLNLGKINPIHLPNIATEYDFSILPLDAYDYVSVHNLPLKENHRDPFDRMLIHTAIRNNLILLSGDKMFRQYEQDGLQLLW
jgi:PIN domain nuclease of toxin-antitoxin system